MKTQTLIAAGAIYLAMSLAPAHAITCEDVRSLTAAKQDYWSQILNLTSAQRHKIWVKCYRDYSRTPRSFDAPDLLQNIGETARASNDR